MKFKENDKVKWNGGKKNRIVECSSEMEKFLKSKKEFIISAIFEDNACRLRHDIYLYDAEWFDKIK